MQTKKEFNKIDVLNFLNCEPSLKSGILGLWLRVFIDCFFTIRDGGDPEDVKSAWLFFEEDNLYFDVFANELQLDPKELRKRVFKALDIEKRKINFQREKRPELSRIKPLTATRSAFCGALAKPFFGSETIIYKK